MPKTRIELLIKEAFASNFTWNDIENFFSINKNILLIELKEFFNVNTKGLDQICEKIASNERQLGVQYER